MELTITRIGNSEGIILPKELLGRMRLKKGDRIYVTETPDGIRLSPYDAALAHTMELAERVMHEDRDVLRKLAE